jgi:AcrR family transcriptional regulator
VTTTRRERIRDATLREIKDVARAHLRAHGPAGISLRGIAREIGMTAPALYRYFGGLDDLLMAMIEDYTDEISDAMEAARDALPPDQLGARLVAVTRAFRRWALDHRPEFAMVFGAPVPGFDMPAGKHVAGGRFGGIFFELFTDLWRQSPFPVPADEDIPPALLRQLENYGGPGCAVDAGVPAGVVRMYAGCWVRLYGLVTMEVFGHVHFLLEDAEPLFEAELHDLGVMLGVKTA